MVPFKVPVPEVTVSICPTERTPVSPEPKVKVVPLELTLVNVDAVTNVLVVAFAVNFAALVLITFPRPTAEVGYTFDVSLAKALVPVVVQFEVALVLDSKPGFKTKLVLVGFKYKSIRLASAYVVSEEATSN